MKLFPKKTLAILAVSTALGACGDSSTSSRADSQMVNASPPEQSEETAIAIFAGGCFWCMEPPFDKLDGVLETTSGYTGGHVEDPDYEQVSAGGTGHAEAVRVTYDPARVDYATLLDVFWHNIDPYDAGGQFCDRGDQYRSAIFTRNDKQQRLAETSKRQLVESGELRDEIATDVVSASAFYPAEAYHQNYYQENPLRYRFYRFTCGRDGRLDEVWQSAAGNMSRHESLVAGAGFRQGRGA